MNRFVLPILAVGLLATGPVALAKPAFVKKAQSLGFADITSCKSCHTAAMPKKENHEFNDRGTWLMNKKKELKAEEVDLAWLKDYKPAK